ncbi:MAG: DTW domain-containing protein [Gammaproteobacteria bacterium]|nr:DTW domain-containing protein [Gammaproteobacteria bacterium]
MSRPFCYQCYRASTACICGLIPTINNKTHITLLQHPTEATHSKGTAIIAQLYLENITTFVAEDFSQHTSLNKLLQQHNKSTAIVYPDHAASSLSDFNESQQKPVSNLIFIDATWRKAKKIWLTSPNLQQLPCIKLNINKASNYRIRKATDPGHLSTIEAMHHCLQHLEPASRGYDKLLFVFNKMIDFQIQKMGEDTYQNNHSPKD